MAGFQNSTGRIERGQSIATAISARAWNRAQDAADIVLAQSQQFGAQATGLSGAPYTFVYLKNVASYQVEQWQAVGITGFECDPTEPQFRSMPVLRGNVPTSLTQCAIALEPIPPNKIGRVAVAGAVQALIGVAPTLTTAQYAKPPLNYGGGTGAYGPLEAAEDGQFTILWKEEGDGLKWAVVRIGGGAPPASVLVKTTVEWQKNTLQTLTVWDTGSAPNEQETEGKTIINAVNKFATIPADKFCLLSRATTGAWYLVAAEC